MIMMAENIDTVNTCRMKAQRNITLIDTQPEHPSNSKDWQKKIEWASTLKGDQLQNEELESQQPLTADSERMIEEPITLRQAQMASVQQQQR
uniref:Uncharacterized protein n=1 Tax=Romanomermis culicivorax TaxID=13658 RepID=A0A915IDV0_ROMCU